LITHLAITHLNLEKIRNNHVNSGQNLSRQILTGRSIVTIVGNGANGFSGDIGPARLANISNITGLSIDSEGGLLVDTDESVRKIEGISGSFYP
jgi:hypothetical protein